MPLSFVHPPLVEIIAEVHWQPKGQPVAAMSIGSPPPDHPIPLLTDGSHESFFSDFADRIASAGFERSERLLPLGFPALPRQVICRFRGKDSTKLFQVGLGVFSVNAVPPYRSWDEFRPIVSEGLAVFFESAQNHSLGTVSEVVLRYVNLFDAALIGSRNASSFVSEIAGVGIFFPQGLPISRDAHERKLDISFGAKLEWGADLRVHIADAIVQGRSGVLLDSTVSVSNLDLTSRDETMALFEQAHTVTRQTFLALTKPILDQMQPMGE